MAVKTVITGVPFTLPPGDYNFKVKVPAGSIVLQDSDNGGSTFETMTDGTFTATGNGVISIAQDYVYQATIDGGNSLTLSLKVLSK